MTKKKKSRRNTALATRPTGPVASATNVAIIRAPSAVSSGRQNRFLTFGSANLAGYPGCRVSGCLPLISIGAANGTGAGLYTRAGSRVPATSFTPLSATFLCPQLGRLASCFMRYRWISTRFDYHPMGSTASAVRLAFAYTSDPMGPVAGVSNYAGYNTLLTTPFSQVFSPWVGWTMNVPVEPTVKYTTLSGTDNSAALRMATSGVIACVADSDPLLDYTYGVVNLAFVLELFDPVSMASAPSLALMQESKLAASDDSSSEPFVVLTSQSKLQRTGVRPTGTQLTTGHTSSVKAASTAPDQPSAATVQ